MPLYIRDDKVDDLATQLLEATGAQNKTEAVRQALLAQLEFEKGRKPLLERLEPLLERAEDLGPLDADFDMKRFTDDLWDGR